MERRRMERRRKRREDGEEEVGRRRRRRRMGQEGRTRIRERLRRITYLQAFQEDVLHVN